MSRFDNELRRAAAPLADEPLPHDILDEVLDSGPGSARAPWLPAFGAVAAILLAVLVGIGIGQIGTESTPSPEPTPDRATAEPMGGCVDVPTRAQGPDVVQVSFPCAPTGTTVMVSRLVRGDLPTVERLEAALRSLLDGPSEEELDAGLAGIVPAGSSGLLGEVTLSDDGLAEVDLSDGLLRIGNLSTSASSGAFLRSMHETAFAFDEVTAILLTAEGSCERLFELFQASCQHFARPVDGLGDCPIIAPAELPSGAPITEPRPYPGQPIVSWGAGDDTVRQHARAGEVPMPEGAIRAQVRGRNAWIAPAGDEPLPLPVEIAWSENGCTYGIVVRLEGGVEGAADYAGRIGPAVAAPSPSPSAPPAKPITVSAEEDGIRLTVTLDRDRTSHGQRVIASAVVENLGPGSVFWGHSGTCVFPVAVAVADEESEPLPYGRHDWGGEAGILKNITVDDRPFALEPRFGFVPQAWLDADGGSGCTTDFQVSELTAGDSVTHEVAWDTTAHHGMPPTPGVHTVEASFNFLSRGAPPAGEEEIDEFSVSLTIPLAVEGADLSYLSPGEAFDVVLADPEFRAHLADAPRSRWMRSLLAFHDGTWEAALYLSATTDGGQVEAIVVTVDAASGEVLGVGLEQRDPPPGG